MDVTVLNRRDILHYFKTAELNHLRDMLELGLLIVEVRSRGRKSSNAVPKPRRRPIRVSIPPNED